MKELRLPGTALRFRTILNLYSAILYRYKSLHYYYLLYAVITDTTGSCFKSLYFLLEIRQDDCGTDMRASDADLVLLLFVCSFSCFHFFCRHNDYEKHNCNPTEAAGSDEERSFC